MGLNIARRGAVAVTALLTASVVLAQNATTAPQSKESASDSLEEVIVTAEKSSESLQDAPAAISSVSEADLVARGVTDIRSLDTFVPSLKSNQEGTATEFIIRGIGKQYDQARIPDAVGMVLDGVLIPQHASALSLFDLQSIEVLPGPQGTLYGSSAIGGIVQVTSNRPTREGETSLLVETGDYGLRHVTVVENDPITSDWSVRAAFNGNYRGAYDNNGTFNDNTSALRLSSLYDPADGNISLFLSGSYSLDHFRQEPGVYHPFNGNAFNIPANDPSTAFFYPPAGVSLAIGDTTEEVATLGGELNWRIGGGVTLTYTPGYLRQADPGQGQFQNTDSVAGFLQVIHSNLTQITNELRLANEQSAQWHWLLGLYQYYQQGLDQDLFGPNLSGYDYLFHSRAYAAFGQLTYSLDDRTKLTVGARASRDSLSTSNADLVFPILPDFTRGTFVYSFDKAWERADWKVGAEHKLSQDSMLYATIQSGFNPGTFEGVFPNPGGEVRPQTMIGYTVGTKNLFLDSRLKVNLEGFLYEYRDQIVTIPFLATGSTIFYNVPKSRSAGAQIDTAFKVTSNTRLYATVGYLNAEFTDFSAPSAATGKMVDYDGYQQSFSPGLTGSVGLEQIFSLGSRGSLSARVDTYASSSYWAGVFDKTPGLQQNDFTKTDASLTYHNPDDDWQVGLWVKNLENNSIISTGGETGRPYPFAASVYVDPPRTYGIRFSVRLKH